MAADVVGYARLMGRDEAGTLLRSKKWRGDCLEPSLARNGGRIVKLTGDGVLAEFGSQSTPCARRSNSSRRLPS
jgi:adenylate cyclase